MHQYHLFFRYMMCKETGEMKSKNNPPMEKRLRFSLNCSLWCIENKMTTETFSPHFIFHMHYQSFGSQNEIQRYYSG